MAERRDPPSVPPSLGPDAGASSASDIRAAVAGERRRIARELHDEFGAAHTAMRLEIAALLARQPPCEATVRERLEHLAGLLERCAVARRALVCELSPAPDRALDLPAALGRLCREWAATAGVRVHLDAVCAIAPARLPATQAHAAYRVAQEALTNAVLHARARQVAVSLAVHVRGLLLVVHDDGRGLPGGTAQAAARGIAGMRQRVQELGGAWSLRSNPGQGTTVRVRLSWARGEAARP